MGSCPCGDFNGQFKFPGPDGLVYVLEMNPGCLDCGIPAGVVVYRMQDSARGQTALAADDWGVGDLPELPFVNDEAYLAVVCQSAVRDRLVEGLDSPESDGYDAIGYLKDHAAEIVTTVAVRTMQTTEDRLDEQNSGAAGAKQPRS